jgi:thioredoxin reductase (NADPH)
MLEVISVIMENVIIIGGGPAGLSAAIYLARAGLSPLVFAGSPPGGQLTLTSEVENFPGYDSILGSELIEKMRKQAQRFGAKIVDENVFKVDFSKRPFEVFTGPVVPFPPASAQLDQISSVGSLKVQSKKDFLNKEPEVENLRAVGIPSRHATRNSYLSKAIIIATGAKALWLNVPGEQELRGKGVSACATCDGFFFKDKVVAVVGGGDTAMEEALTLTKFAKKVYIIHRRDSFRASKIMRERVFANKKIEVIWNAQVVEVMGKNHLEGIKIKSTYGENLPKFKILAVDGLFVAIGHKPDTEIFAGQVELDEKGYVITTQRLAMELAKLKTKNEKIKMTIENEKLEKIVDKFDFNYQMATSVLGVFAAGDCVDYVYRQAATAAGMGVSAALEVERWLESSIK